MKRYTVPEIAVRKSSAKLEKKLLISGNVYMVFDAVEDTNGEYVRIEEAKALESQLTEMQDLLGSLVWLIDNSNGLAEFHLNGDVAEWDEFPEVELARTVVYKAAREE